MRAARSLCWVPKAVQQSKTTFHSISPVSVSVNVSFAASSSVINKENPGAISSVQWGHSLRWACSNNDTYSKLNLCRVSRSCVPAFA